MTLSDGGTKRQLLLVEDNPGDARMVAEAMTRAGMTHVLHVVEDGQQAMSFVRREQPYDQAPWPDLILLDLNLPSVDGREVLAQIKADPNLKVIPVVVLTSSDAESDVVGAYKGGASTYIIKPPTFAELVEIMRTIDGYWLTLATLPPVPAADRSGTTR